MANPLRRESSNHESSSLPRCTIPPGLPAYLLAMFHVGNFGRTLLVCLLLGLLTLGIYRPVVRHDFINLDDYDYVKDNPAVTSGLTWHGASWAFLTGHSGNWHPITWLSHMLD